MRLVLRILKHTHTHRHSHSHRHRHTDEYTYTHVYLRDVIGLAPHVVVMARVAHTQTQIYT